ncbi:unnamed protein product [Arctogadus glacialis]
MATTSRVPYMVVTSMVAYMVMTSIVPYMVTTSMVAHMVTSKPKEESRSLGQQKPALEVDLQPMKKDRDLLKAPGAGPAGRRFSN